MAASRTEFDQDEYDVNRYVRDWTEFLRLTMSERLNNPWWTAQVGRNNVIVYRPSVFPGVMAATRDSMIMLHAPEDSAHYQFYIPQAILTDANARNMGFVVRRGNLEVTIMPNTIIRENPALLSAMDRINNRTTPALDYYLRITLDFTTLPTFNAQGVFSPTIIDGGTVASDRVDIRVELVTARQTAEDWDRGIAEMVNEFIENDTNFTSVAQELMRRFRRGDSNEQMLRFVDEYVNTRLPAVYAMINTRLISTLDAAFELTTFNRPVRLEISGIGNRETVGGFRMLNNRWMPQTVETVNVFGGVSHSINITQNGIYIFTSIEFAFSGLEALPNGNRLAEIINRYSLGDFIGRGGSFDINANLTMHSLVGAAARLGGANNGADAAAFLRGHGFNVTVRNTVQTANMQEMIFTMMAVYEIRTGTAVSSVRITNFGLTAGINGIEPQFAQSVRAAFELGVMEDAGINPNAVVTVREFLEIIGRLDRLIRL